MPTITLNKTEFEKLVGKELPLEQLKDRISMLGTDLEKIEGNEIHVEIFPNRPDMLSEQGFARAFSSFIGMKTGLRKYEVQESGEKVIIEPSVEGIRPFTACAIVKNIAFTEERIREIIQIQEKLHVTYGRNRKKCAIGVYPLEKIIFPVTYKADLPEKIIFQPLEASRKMNALEILEEHKAGKEYAHLLSGMKRYPFFIDAKDEILSMPPVINSHTTGRVTERTKDIFIECSGFDFETLSICLNIIVTALADMGGKIFTVELHYGKEKKKTPSLFPRKMKLDLPYINQRLGLQLTEKETQQLLEKMGFGYEKGEVLIPAYRADILHQVDFVEDIAIAYGYENFNEEIPRVATIGEEAPLEKFCTKVREVFMGLSFLEVKNYHLLTLDDLNKKMNLQGEAVPLKNALGEHNHLRNSLLPSLLKNLTENQHHEYPQLLFEIGKVFTPERETESKTETGVHEEEKLSVAICHEKADFTEMKQTVDAFFRALGMEVFVKEGVHPSFIPGRGGEIFLGEEKLGFLGEVHPQVLSNWNLPMPAVVAEIEVEKVFGLIG